MTDLNIENFSIDKSSWSKVKFGDVVYEPKESVKDPVAEGIEHVVGLEHIDSEDIHLRRSASIEEGTTFTKRFRRGDVLFGRRRAYLKKAARAEFGGICSGDIIVMRASEELLLPELLPFLVNNDKFFDYAVTHSAGGLSPRTKFKDISNLEFDCPPKQEQVELLSLLEMADYLYSAKKNSDEKLTQVYHALRETLCFNNGADELITNHKLKREVDSTLDFHPLADCLSDIKYGTSKKASNEQTGRPIIGIPNVVNEKLTTDNVAYVNLTDKEYQSYKLNFGDIVIVRTNGNPEYTGRSALYDQSGEHVYASYLIKLSVKPNILDPEFLVRYLQTNTVRRYFKRHATSSAGNYNINTETIKALPVPNITICKQQEIVNCLRKAEECISASVAQLKSAKILFKGLSKQVF